MLVPSQLQWSIMVCMGPHPQQSRGTWGGNGRQRVQQGEARAEGVKKKPGLGSQHALAPPLQTCSNISGHFTAHQHLFAVSDPLTASPACATKGWHQLQA